MKKLFILAAAMSVAVSCTDADVADPDYATNVRDDSAPVFYGGFDDEDTRTYIDEKVRLLWTADDRVSIFTTTYNQQYAFDGETGDNSGSFVKIADGSFATGSDTERNYAVYPYAKSNKISYDNILTVTLPAVQTYAANSFGPGANTMVAVTENSDDYFLKFRNVGGFIKLKLYGDDITVASVSVMGNKSEPVAGKASVSVAYGYYPTVTMSDTATGTVTLDCGEGVGIGTTAEESTEFWIVVPPTLFSEGFTITVTDTAGKIFTKSTSKSIEIVRNGVLSMSAIEVVPKIPTNQIWYTSNDGNIVEPHAADVFGANIVSNTYENGRGVITFDGEVTSIGWDAFRVCNSLTSIIIPDSVTSIGSAAFAYCDGLTNITIPDSITSIGDHAFFHCSSITSVNVPDGVTSIEYGTFHGCSNMTSINIPDSVTSIGDYAFWSCGSLTSINIPDSVTKIEHGVFGYCSNLTSITIPNGVTSIGEMAFNSCRSLTSIIIPNGVTSIGEMAFIFCKSLTSITIPNSVISIGDAAFASCYNLSCFSGKFSTPDQRCLIVNGILVASAPFGLTECKIPDGVTSIGYEAFRDCIKLTRIDIPNGVTSIGEMAFIGCSNLTSVTIPNSVISIGDAAFASCYNLSCFSGKFSTPDQRCLIVNGILVASAISGLTEYKIPDGVTSIGDNAFDSGMFSLTSIDIPDSVTSIGDYAFYNCHRLTSITIPENVTSIENCALYIPTNIYCKPTTPPILGLDALSSTSSAKIYVPMASVDAYKSAQYWSSYADKIVGYDFN